MICQRKYLNTLNQNMFFLQDCIFSEHTTKKYWKVERQINEARYIVRYCLILML